MKIEGSAPATEFQVQAFNKQKNQAEAVSSELISSVEASPTPRAAEQSGQILNLSA